MTLHQVGLGNTISEEPNQSRFGFLGFNMHWDDQAPLNASTMLTRWLWDNIFRGLLEIIGIDNDAHDCYWILGTVISLVATKNLPCVQPPIYFWQPWPL